MNSISFIITTLGWSIVHSLWQVALIGLGVKLLLTAFRKSAPVIKYNIVLAGFGLMFTSFCVTLAIVAEQEINGGGSGVLLLDTALNPMDNFTGDQNRDLVSSSTDRWSITLVMQKIDGSLRYIVGAWFVGFIFFAFRFMGSYLYISRLKRIYSLKPEDKWQTVLQGIQSRLGIRRAVTLLESATTNIPVVIGHLKPVIILPVGLLTQIPFNQLEAILAHELAHIRRNDYLVNLIIASMEWFFFYHPIYWWLSRNLDLYREHCCDDITIAYCGEAEPLQKALIDLSKNTQPSIHIAAALYRNDYQLLNRIKRMKTKNQKNHGKRFSPAALLLMLGVLVIILAGSSFTPRPNDMLHGILLAGEANGPAADIIIREPAPVKAASLIQATNPVQPDSTKKTGQKTTVKEFQDEGVISLELDSEGNLLKVKKDGKELTGEDRKKYDRLAAKLKELKEDEKAKEVKKEEMDRIRKQLQETELKMKEVQQQYSEVMNDYMRLKSEAGGTSSGDVWGLYQGYLMDTEELEQYVQENLDLAGIYSRDLMAEQFAKQEQWIDLQNDLFEDNYRLSHENLEELLKEADLQRLLSDEMLDRKIDEIADMHELKRLDMETRLFEEVVRKELLSDGLIENANDKISLKLNAKRLVVNGQKQDAELHKKYLRIYNKYSSSPLAGDTQVIIED